ncbi:glucose 1-dehydrogenase [Mesorhizobium sp. NZP2298]|nr:glucose 1-dehydrogenase [Mesorhizobium sp. NZP2298]
MYPELNERVAIITGGASGIGWAAARRLAAEGARVVIVDLDRGRVDTRVRELTGNHIGLVGDVSDEPDVSRFVEATLDHFGRLDVLINSAGKSDSFRATVDQDVGDFRRLVDVHLTGTYMMSKVAAKAMFTNGAAGSVINVSSIAGIVGLVPRTAYSAAKAAISMMTRTMGCEWVASGVRVNAVAPGYVLTPLVQELIDAGKVDAERICRRTPAGRFGTSEEIANAMAFLASDQSAFITGVTLPVDGGYMSWGTPADAFAGEL